MREYAAGAGFVCLRFSRKISQKKGRGKEIWKRGKVHKIRVTPIANFRYLTQYQLGEEGEMKF